MLSILVGVALSVGAAAQTPETEWRDALAQASAVVASAPKTQKVGLMLMAHGGSPDWNAAVEAAAAPLRHAGPVEIAFGMADAAAMQDALTRLENQGAARVAVVRVFISGESFLERTEQILGLRPGAPPRPPHGGHPGHGHGGHGMEFWRAQTRAELALSQEGFMDGPQAREILLGRAKALSRDPRTESVVLLAHGPESDAENRRWLARMNEAAAPMHALGFRAVSVETLREDWPDERRLAEARIRAFVQDAARGGGRAIVIPYRLFGFGPYREVLAGLTYESDGLGFLPHPKVSDWVRSQAAAVCAARGWSSPF